MEALCRPSEFCALLLLVASMEKNDCGLLLIAAGRQRRFSQNMSSHSARRPLNLSSEGGGTGLARSAGKMLMPIFDRLANSIMGDSPELLTELRWV